MEFSANVPAEHFKILSLVLDLFSNFSETISLDIRNTQFIIGAINNSRTAQCICRFSRSFFQNYKLLRRESPNTSMQLTVSNKLLNSMFKKSTSNVLMCQIRITEENVDKEHHVPSKIFIQRVSQAGGKSKSSIPYTDGDRIEPLYLNNNMHHFVMSHLMWKAYFNRFHPKVVNIVFECTPHTITVQSYWDEKSSKGDRPVQTTFTINSIDCHEYSVIEPVRVVVNLKEFKAVYEFMESLEHTIHCSFEDVGKPIIFSFKHLNLVALEVALMTQNDESSNNTGMEDLSVNSIPSEMLETPPPPAKNHRSNRNTTPQTSRTTQQQQQNRSAGGAAGPPSNRNHAATNMPPPSPMRQAATSNSSRQTAAASPLNL